MLSYKVLRNGTIKLYAYRRTILSLQIPGTQSEIHQEANALLDSLQDGSEEVARDCAEWIVTHGDTEHLNRSLGPHFYLKIEDSTVYRMDDSKVVTVQPHDYS